MPLPDIAIEPAPQTEAHPHPEPAEPSSADREAFLAAYRVQFRGAPYRALAAWDEFLARHPRGELAREARYHRAVTLMRLGRYAEARAELSPFASGAHGELHREDARQLLLQLSAAERR